MLRVIGSIVTGTPAVAPPKDLERYQNKAGSDLDEGVAVQLSGGDDNVGELDEADQDGSNMFGITLEEIEDDAFGRVQMVAPGMIIKGEADAEADVGDTVGLNSDRDGFDDGSNGAFLVIRVEKDEDGDYKVLSVVPIGGALAVA